MHGAQRFSYNRQIKAGDEIEAVSTITTVRKAAGVDVIMYDTVLTAGGEQVAVCTSTISHAGELS